ncbi:hypothetical protein [Nakamurella sp.]|uniref:hypothetical protein n=1 Tax=Nakamurella sp. TaxID=1869182 RepID=UPI0037849339
MAAFDARFPAAPATVLRRRREVLRAHRAAGHPPPPSRSEPAADPGATSVLGSIQVRGWPDGVSGRRDAFLIVMRAHLTRPELARADAVAVLAVLADTTLGTEPGGCLRCGLTRWLRVLAVASVGGWRSVQRRMAGQFPAAAADESEHDCQRPLRPGWRLMPLLPAVDRHGNVDVTGPISGRAITAATSRRRQSHTNASTGTRLIEPPLSPVVHGPKQVVWDRADTLRDLHWLDRRLDHLEVLVADLDAAVTAANRVAAGPTGQVDGTG